MSFCIHDSDVAVCNNERVVIHETRNNAESTVLLPELRTEKKLELHNNLEIESFHMITNVTFSRDGKYLSVCTNRKQLCLYERESLKLLSNRTLVRAASRVRFTPSNDIIVADKAGDAYAFSTERPTESGCLLLGHLSMLLDVLVTDDEKYVVTADRDEKIRVSMYPNSYNVVAYCLGHTKFVTNICELPHDKAALLSAGGDGVFIIWDYARGREILSTSYRDKVPERDVHEFNRNLQDCHLEESVDILPVKQLRLLELDTTTSLAVITFHSNTLLLVYRIEGTVKTSFKATYVQSLTLNSEPIECLFHDLHLWILTDIGFEVYVLRDDCLVLDDAANQAKRLNTLWESLKVDTLKQNLFPILYKRKYDNVQEYLERKKVRVGTTVE